jgi:hypothetical protein
VREGDRVGRLLAEHGASLSWAGLIDLDEIAQDGVRVRVRRRNPNRVWSAMNRARATPPPWPNGVRAWAARKASAPITGGRAANSSTPDTAISALTAVWVRGRQKVEAWARWFALASNILIGARMSASAIAA